MNRREMNRNIKKDLLCVGTIVTLSAMLVVSNNNTKHERAMKEELIADLETSQELNAQLSQDLLVLSEDYKTTTELLNNTSIDLIDTSEELSKTQKLAKDLSSRDFGYDKSEIYYLAQCVQAEAGDWNPVSQKMITQTILNRVNSIHFPNTIREVINQKHQFEVVSNGSINNTPTYKTLANVYSVLLFGYDMPDKVLFFYADWLKDNWVCTLDTYKVVEGTVFCYAPSDYK